MTAEYQVSPASSNGPPLVDIRLLDKGKRRQVSAPGLRTFLEIMDIWGLSEAERLRVLGQPGRSTYHAWAMKARSGAGLTLPLDVLLRISAVLGIHKALGVVFTGDEAGVAWLKSPNSGRLFGGQAPMELVTSGTQDGLLAVRRYLDAWRGGVFAAPVPAVDSGAEALEAEDIVFL